MRGWIALCLFCGASTVSIQGAELRIGIIGTDTSHAVAFTQLINDSNDPNHVAGGKVVAAFKGGSPDVESSATRVEEYAKELNNKYGIELCETIEALITKVDCVLLESVDGRPHLEQVKPVIAAHKSVFIDKPFAGSLRDAIEIYRLAREARVPVFTSSAYRYYGSMVDLQKQAVGDLRSAISYGPAHLEPHHPSLFWYGIHPVEGLYTVMGGGCESVTCTYTDDTQVVTGVWAGGRVGVLHGLRNQSTPHGVTVFGTKASATQPEGDSSYAPLVQEIMKFFQTGIAPVSPEVSLEIYAFMEAADESHRQGGVAVRLQDVMKMNGAQ